MDQKNTYVFNEDDEKAIEIFVELGMPRHISKTLMYISRIKECQSQDIEQGAELRQPEVSVAINELQNRGWINMREQKKDGKGRPTHIYKMTTNLSSIIATMERNKTEEYEWMKRGIAELKNLFDIQ